MAHLKEAVQTSPTTESCPLDELSVFRRSKLKPGQYSIDTCFDVSCESHKDKKAILRLSGDLNLEYKEDAGLSKWSQLESCELAGCNLQCDVAKHEVPRLFYTEALRQALSSDACPRVRLECGHGVVPECSTCSKISSPESNDANDSTAARPSPQNETTGDDASASTEASVCDSSTDLGSDAPTEDTQRTEAEAQDNEENHKKDPSFLLWLPYYRKPETGSPSQADGQKELSEGGSRLEQQTEGSIEPSVDTKETKPSKEPAQDRAEVKEPDPDPTRKPDSASQPDTDDKASRPQKQRLSKDAKLQRTAALKQQREERKKAHEEEIQDITEEISHQREVLRSRRDQKKHQKKLKELQKQLERLCQKELDDSDYATTEDEAENEDTSDSSDQPSDEKDGDASKDEGDAPASEEQGQSATEEDGDKAQESEAEDPNVWVKPSSKAKQDWEDQKETRGEENSYIDEMMDKIGLESVKVKMLEIKTLVDTARRQDVDLKKERFNTVFMGSPGTGKTTVASALANLYGSLAVVDDYFTKTTGAKLVYDGVNEVKNVINNIDERGVVFIDDAHILRPDSSSTGRKVLDYIVSEMDRLQGQMIFIFAGHGKQMEAFLAHNSSLQSRIPFTIKFDDYENVELLQILQKQLHDKFNDKMKVEKGIDGVYMRMTARRIGRGRGNPSFGNAREVENTLQRILFRQATRLEQARKSEQEADDLLLTMEDIVGPPPSTALESSKAWQSLQEMVGLKTVKESLKSLVHRLQINYDREIIEKPIVECPLNRIFLGSPGTGKTTVAKYYGQIMVDIGLLSDGEVVVKNPADFIGQYIGESENITKQILASTKGKVLIIDEAYGLSDMSDETNDRACGNIYKTAIIDTLVSNIQGTANEDRCVLLLGYRNRMERMFQHVNPGLSRRFPMSSAFEFDDFTDEELRQILDTKLKNQGFTITDQARQVAMEMLSRARNHLNFGNAGEIDILLGKAKESQQARLAKQTEKCDDPFLLESEDFDSDFERPNHAEARIKDLFKDFVGAENVVDKLLGYSRIVQNTKALEIDPRSQIPFNYLFRGPPGTGKTTTARRIGQVFYDMGILATDQVYDCSATDLIGEYIGQTGPKCQKVFQRALGKVLFIDEAYRLNDERYGKEALIEMLNILTKEAYKNKLVTVLAGYSDDINKLLQVNPGLGSRFPEVIEFENLKPKQCVELFVQRLEDQKLDATAVKPDRVTDRLKGSFERLSALPDWGNARDVDILAKSVFGRILKESSAEKPSLVVKEDDLDAEVAAMITEREQRSGNTFSASHLYL